MGHARGGLVFATKVDGATLRRQISKLLPRRSAVCRWHYPTPRHICARTSLAAIAQHSARRLKASSTSGRSSQPSRNRSSKPRRVRRARAILSLAAFYASDDIPEELFTQAPENYPAALARTCSEPRGARKGDRRAQSLLARRFCFQHAHIFGSSAGAASGTGRACVRSVPVDAKCVPRCLACVSRARVRYVGDLRASHFPRRHGSFANHRG